MNQEDTKQDTQIAVMATDLKYIKEAIKKLDDRLVVMDSHYIKRDEVLEMKRQAEKEHAEHASAIENLKIARALDQAAVQALRQELAVFKTQVMTWAGAGILVMGIAQFIIGKFF